MPTYDEISDLSDEDQQRYHEYTQRSLRKRWANAKAKTEREHDDQQRRNPT